MASGGHFYTKEVERQSRCFLLFKLKSVLHPQSFFSKILLIPARDVCDCHATYMKSKSRLQSPFQMHMVYNESNTYFAARDITKEIFCKTVSAAVSNLVIHCLANATAKNQTRRIFDFRCLIDARREQLNISPTSVAVAHEH